MASDEERFQTVSANFEWVLANDTRVFYYAPGEESPAEDGPVPEGKYHVMVQTWDNGLGIEGTKEEIIELAYRLLDVAKGMGYTKRKENESHG
jgi:hypothetical protein